MCGTSGHISTKFSDNWLKTATCISQNVTISFKHEYWKPTLTSRCDVIGDIINIKNTFGGIISDDLSISDVKMNLSKIFWKFQNGRHFEVRASFTPEVVPEFGSYNKTGHTIPYILSFWFTRSSNINEVIAISKFDLLFNLVTYLFDLWPWNTTTFCTEPRYIRGWKIVKICQSHRDLCVKMC